jgi:Leucine-rich repeat (LRR) protein
LRALKLRLLPCTSGEPEWLPRVLAGLTNLTSLDLSGSLDLRNQHLVNLSLPKLQSLDLSGTTVSEAALQCLYTLTQLTRLDLSNCRNCRDCSPLAALLYIQTLSLSGCNVRDRDLESLQDLTTLRHLSLNGCRQLTSHGLAHLSGLCALCSLEAPGCVCVSDGGLQGLSRLTNLHTLNLGRWSDNYFPHVVAPGVDHCWLLTDDALVALEPFRR